MKSANNYIKLVTAIFVLFQIIEILGGFAAEPLRYGVVAGLLAVLVVLFFKRMENAAIPLPRVVDFLLVTVMNLLAGPIFVVWYVFLAGNAILSIPGPMHYWLVALNYLGYMYFFRDRQLLDHLDVLRLLTDSALYAMGILFCYYQRFLFAQVNKVARLYHELRESHLKLEEYSRKAEQLSAMEERNRIAREIHDSLGHTLTAMIMQLEAGELALDSDISAARQRIVRARELARESMTNLREAVSTLRLHTEEEFAANLQGLADALGLTSEGFTLNISGDYLRLSSLAQSCIYRAIQEALTNARRHGHATHVRAELVIGPKVIHLTVQDNGQGSGELKPGFGLTGIEERVSKLKGQVSFATSQEGGFTLTLELPVSKGEENGENPCAAG